MYAFTFDDPAAMREWAAFNVERTRRRLAEALDEGNGYEELARQALAVAEAEGTQRAVEVACRAIDAGHDAAKVVKVVGRQLLMGADDTWSGRGNDARRAWFDGYREAAERIVEAAEDR